MTKRTNILAPWERKKTEFNEILRLLDIRTSTELADNLKVHRNTAYKYIRGSYDHTVILAMKGQLLEKRLQEGQPVELALEKYRNGEKYRSRK